MNFNLENDGLIGPFELGEPDLVDKLVNQLDRSNSGFKNFHTKSGVCRLLLSSSQLSAQVKINFGERLKLWRTNAFKKITGSGEVKWHHDRHFETGNEEVNFSNLNNHYSILVALTDMDESSGIMEFIPGSHLPCPGYSRDTRPFHTRTVEEHFLSIPEDLLSKRVKVPLRKGQFMLFHSGLLHRSLPASSSEPIYRYSLVARLCINETVIPEALAKESETLSYPINTDANKKLLDKVVLVTGGGTGIGRAIAETCLNEGAKVIISGRREVVLNNAVEEMSLSFPASNIMSFTADASNWNEMQNLMNEVCRSWVGIDIAFVNAGTNNCQNELLDVEMGNWKNEVFNNISATTVTCKLVAENMRDSGGNIILVGSGIGHIGGKGNSAYAAAKAVSWSLTQTLARELARFKINVNELIPGPVKTDMNPDAKGEQWKNPEDVVELAILLATQNKLNGATGQSFALKRTG